MNAKRFRQRGVSLIEALVAFAVMSFGMLGVVGMQATLRTGADSARQRDEAVRIAQDYVEEWRGFSTLASATPGRMTYADIASGPDITVTGPNSNATYTVTRQVTQDVAVEGTVTPARRTLGVTVSWLDRSNQPQTVQLNSAVAGIEPELSASIIMAASADPVVAPRGRFRGMPPGAVALGGGRSGYVPPGQTATGDRVAWVFNNMTGVITLCTTSGFTSAELLATSAAPVCSTTHALLLSGGMRFATAGPPEDLSTGVTNPAGPIYPTFAINVAQTVPDTRVVRCFTDPLDDTQVNYYCAVPLSVSTLNWSGSIIVGSPPTIAASLAEVAPDQYKVCRYFAAPSYGAVSTATLNQNFVLIKAGNGTVPYTCPEATVPRTWAHQPTT